MNARARQPRWAWILTAVAMALFWAPLPAPLPAGLLESFSKVAHIAGIAGLAALWAAVLPPSWRGWRLVVMMAVGAAGIETVQSLTGRVAQFSDWAWGVSAAAIICGTQYWPRRCFWRGIALGGVLFAGGFYPGIMHYWEAQAFPVILQPGACWARRNWVTNGVKPVKFTSEKIQFHMTEPMAYPGVFRQAARRNWGEYDKIILQLGWPGSAPAIWTFRVDDRPRNPAYADRAQVEFMVTQGWNRVELSRRQIHLTPSGRPMDFENVEQWGVFLVAGGPFEYFELGEIRIQMPREAQ